MALSVAEPIKQQQAAKCVGPFADVPQAWYWWQQALVYSLVHPMCIQAKHRQLLTVDHFVTPNREPREVTGSF